MPLLPALVSAGRTAVSRWGSRVVSKIGQRLSGPAAKSVAIGAGAGYVGSSAAGWMDAGPATRRRRKGLSGRDIEGAQRVMKLVSTFGYKPKLPCRRKGRKCR